MIEVSIIIPMYNVAEYLKTCIESVLNQNLSKNTFEVIMVDDESSDNSKFIAHELASKYAFIKVISQKNKGLGGARNTGILNSQGNFVLFLDADDTLIPNSLNKIIQIANSNNLDILEFGANLVDNSKNILKTVSRSSDHKIYDGITYYNTIKYSGSACNKLYSRIFMHHNSLLFLEKIYGEDFEFNTRAFFMANKVLATNLVCSEFLQSPNSITRNKSKITKDKYLNDFIKILTSINNFKKQHSINPKNKKASVFFNERLTMVNINAFYLMFKNNYSFNDMINYKNKLIENQLFFVDFPIAIKKKELFRKYMLKNFSVFKLTQPIKSLLNI